MSVSEAARRRQRKKTNIFDESGLTDADRRAVRTQQRTLQEAMISKDIGWEEGRAANNEIFDSKVAYSRELVIDVDNCTIALSGFAKEVEAKVQVPRFDAMKLIDKLSQKAATKSGFNWAALGREAGVCFCAVPGALDSEVHQRAKPKKRAKSAEDEPKEKVEETRPEEVTNNKSDGDKLSAMEKLNRKMKTRLEKRTNEEKSKGSDNTKLDAVRFLFNPKSFTQTVENIFTYSFLVKKGNGGIGVYEHNNLKSLFVEWMEDRNESVQPPPRQSVCSFTMADFRRLAEGVDKYDLPNRKAPSS